MYSVQRGSDCIKRIDPIGTALRWRLVIRRRKYYVPAPNSLWHIDSAHKLIKYKLVVPRVYRYVYFYCPMFV